MKHARVGIVGVGGMRIADYHAREFARDNRAELVACCDIQPDALRSFAERFAIAQRYTSYEKMLQEAGLDIVVICTNETLHAEMTVMATKYAPKAILCEKPMALSLHEADAMLEACARAATLLIIGHQRRYKPQYAVAKELLRDGAIGELEEIRAAGHPGTSLLVDGTHTVDLVRFYLDDMEAEWVFGQVDARSGRIGWGHVLEDAAMMVVKFGNGVRAHITLGGHITPAREAIGTAKPFNYHRLVLAGSRGQIIVAGDTPVDEQPLLQVCYGSDTRAIPADHRAWHSGVSPHSDLLQALTDGHIHPLNGNSARATLEILMATYESSRLRRVIELPLQNLENPLEQMLGQA